MLRDLTASEWEVVRSALRYYGQGVAYAGKHGNRRQQMRAERALVLANRLDATIPTTIDDDGTGEGVRLLPQKYQER